MSERIKIAIDDGYAHTKLAWYDDKGRLQTFSIPSLAGSGAQVVTDLAGNPVMGYQTEGQRFTVGPLPNALDTSFEDYPVSALNRCIVQHALISAGFGDKALHAGLTLPFEVFYKRRDFHARRLESLRKQVEPLDEQAPRAAKIEEARLYPEAAVAWIDAYIDDMGMPVRDTQNIGPVAIVDIGGRTTDIAIYHGPNMIDQERSGTDIKGVKDVLRIIEQRVAERHNGIILNRAQTENALKTGKVRIYREVDISEIVDEAKRIVANELYMILQRRINRAFELEDIVFIGGGAEVMREALVSHPNFPQARVLDQPQFSNARGVLKFMTFVDP